MSSQKRCPVCQGIEFEEQLNHVGLLTGYICASCDNLYPYELIQDTQEAWEQTTQMDRPLHQTKITARKPPKSWMSYEQGLQIILCHQVRTLVKKFGIPDIIIPVVGKIWFCFLSSNSLSIFRSKRAMKPSSKPSATRDTNDLSDRNVGSLDQVMAEFDDDGLFSDVEVNDANGDVPQNIQTQEWPSKDINVPSNISRKIKISELDNLMMNPGDVNDDVIEEDEEEDPSHFDSLASLRKWPILPIPRIRSTLMVTLVIIFISLIFIRVPVLPMDICKWARNGKIPYLSAHRLLPKTMARKPFLKPRTIPKATRIEYYGITLLNALRLDFKWPPVNVAPVLFRMVNDLQLPRVIEFSASRVMSINPKTDYHIHNLAYALIMAHIVFVLKLLFFFDDRYDSISINRPSDINISSLGELMELQQKRLEESHLEFPWTLEELRKLPDDGLDAFIDFCRNHVLSLDEGKKKITAHTSLVRMFQLKKHPLQFNQHKTVAKKGNDSESSSASKKQATIGGRQARYIMYKNNSVGEYHKSYTLLLTLCANYLEIPAIKIQQAIGSIEQHFFSKSLTLKEHSHVKITLLKET